MPLPKHQTLSAAGQPGNLALLLASCIRHRREALGLSIERAAQLTGIESSQWQALEAGWVPNLESGMLEAISETLEACLPHVFFIAEVSGAFQSLPVQKLASLVPSGLASLLITSYPHLCTINQKGGEAMPEGKIKRMNINVELSLHHAFKAATAARGENMTDVLMKFIEDYVNKHTPAALKR
jgi:hypothetical protein